MILPNSKILKSHVNSPYVYPGITRRNKPFLSTSNPLFLFQQYTGKFCWFYLQTTSRTWALAPLQPYLVYCKSLWTPPCFNPQSGHRILSKPQSDHIFTAPYISHSPYSKVLACVPQLALTSLTYFSPACPLLTPLQHPDLLLLLQHTRHPVPLLYPLQEHPHSLSLSLSRGLPSDVTTSDRPFLTISIK